MQAALAALVKNHGKEPGHQLSAEKIHAATATWTQYAQHTRSTYSKCLRRFLRWLEEIGQAPLTTSRAVPRFHQPEARGVTATDDERHKLLTAADPALRFFLLLCADLGIRHRTAARMTLGNWQPATSSLSFTTKGNTHQTLPVTPEIADTLTRLPADSPRNVPIVALLHTGRPLGPNPRMLKRWWKLKEKLGIRDELRIHDLRRTVAEDVWEATHDLRIVQAQLGHRSPTTTARYLANKIHLQDLQPVLAKVQEMRIARSRNS
jgi:integrase